VRRPISPLFSRTAICFAVAVLNGCVYVSGTDSHDSFGAQNIVKIEPGRTTKKQVLDLFGPPAGIARKGQEEKIIPVLRVRAETLIELFSARQTLNDGDIVYYYRNVALETRGGAVLLAVHSSRSVQTQELWILIDDNAGIVRDYVTKGGNAK